MYITLLAFLVQIQNFSNKNEVFYKLINTDARGNVTEDYFGSGVRTFRSYNEITNQIERIQSWLLTDFYAPSLQNLEYDFDDFGNLTYREDFIQNIREDINYDLMNRLDTSTTNYGNGQTDYN